MKRNTLKIGDKVSWRGSWGQEPAMEATIEGIEINCINKSGKEVSSVNWERVNDRSVIVNLNNGHWAYGNQISMV